MRIAAIADIHLANHAKSGGTLRSGINARANAIIAALRDACRTAIEQECEVLLVCGDLFDNVKPLPQLITAVCNVFAASGIDTIYVLVGNHDMVSEDEGDHALGPLHSISNVYVVDKPLAIHAGKDLSTGLVLLPYRIAAVHTWLDSEVTRLCAELDALQSPGTRYPRVLALHAGISDKSTKYFLEGARDSIPASTLGAVMDSHNVEFAVAGNWHDHKVWHTEADATIVQCGALVPTGFDNAGTDGYGSLVVYDTATRVWSRTEIQGPRFITVRGDLAMEAYREAAEKVGSGVLHVRYKGPPSNLGAMAATMQADELLLVLASVEAVPDESDYAQVRTAAAHAAQAAGTNAEDAVRAYVAAMPMVDASIDRALITTRVLGYLQR